MKKHLLKESVLFITGRRENITLKGKNKPTKAFVKVLVASKNLYEALHDPNVTLKEIKALVEQKKQYAKQYEIISGKLWPI